MKVASIKLYTVNSTKADPYLLTVTPIEDGVIGTTSKYRFNIGDAEVDLFLLNVSLESLRKGPSFAEQWEEVRALLSSFDYLCCYRSGDDFNALYQSIHRRGLALPSVSMFDVQGLSRRLFPYLPDYMYRSVAYELGFPISPEMPFSFVCDSETTADLLLKIIGREDVETLDKAFLNFQITPGRMDENGYQKLSMTSRRDFLGLKDPKVEDLVPDPNTSVDPLNFFYDKNVVFTGSFKKWGFETKTECQQLVVNIGGYPQKGLNSHTNVLVEGIQISTKKVDGEFTDSGKQKKAREMKAKGKDIEIISGDVFFDETFDYRLNFNKIKK